MSRDLIRAEIVAAVDEAKKHIRDAAAVAVDEFSRKTGLSPSGITIQMMETTTVGSRTKTYIVGEVIISLGRL